MDDQASFTIGEGPFYWDVLQSGEAPQSYWRFTG